MDSETVTETASILGLAPQAFWAIVAILVMVAVGLAGRGVWKYRQRRRRVSTPPPDPILGPLQDALIAFQALGSPVGLELPGSEVEITQVWADGIRQTAEFVAERQQEAIVHRGQRRVALRALKQIRRGVERVISTEEQAVEEAHTINEIAQSLGMEPLEIVSEEDQNVAFNALRRANEQAEGMA